MMFQSGKAYSLLDLGQKFLAFAQLSNEDTTAEYAKDKRRNIAQGIPTKTPLPQ